VKDSDRKRALLHPPICPLSYENVPVPREVLKLSQDLYGPFPFEEVPSGFHAGFRLDVDRTSSTNPPNPLMRGDDSLRRAGFFFL